MIKVAVICKKNGRQKKLTTVNTLTQDLAVYCLIFLYTIASWLACLCYIKLPRLWWTIMVVYYEAEIFINAGTHARTLSIESVCIRVRKQHGIVRLREWYGQNTQHWLHYAVVHNLMISSLFSQCQRVNKFHFGNHVSVVISLLIMKAKSIHHFRLRAIYNQHPVLR